MDVNVALMRIRRTNAITAVKIGVHLNGLSSRMKERKGDQDRLLFSVGKVEHREMTAPSRDYVRPEIQVS